MDNKDIIKASVLGFISSFEATMILIAVPAISGYFDISYFQSSLLITIYVAIESLLFVPFSIFFGKYGLKFGMVLGGILIATSGFSIFFSNNFLEVEFFRSMQAIGAAMVLPSSLAYASSTGDDIHRGKAIGINHTIISLGYVLGLPAGGIIAIFNWKILFLLSSIVAIAGIISVLKISNIREKSSIGFSAFGPGLLLSGIVVILWNIYAGIIAIITGILLSLKSRLPSEYVKSSTGSFFHSITRNGFAAFLVFLYASLGYNTFHYSLLILIFPLSFTFFSMAGGKFSDKFGRKYTSILGFSLMSVFSVLIFINIILAEIFLGIASGIATTSNTSYTMNSLTGENRITGSALRTLQGTVSMSIGLTVAAIISVSYIKIIIIIIVLNTISLLLVLFYNSQKMAQN